MIRFDLLTQTADELKKLPPNRLLHAIPQYDMIDAPYNSTTPTTTMWAFPKEKK